MTAAPRGGLTPAGPVIVLTYSHAGGDTLRALLAAHPTLATLSGPGLAQLSGHIAEAWRQVEQQRAGRLSVLARTATKAMFTTVLTAHLAREGSTRWCDTTPGAAGAAGVFADLYPDVAFISLHRNCADMIRSGLRSCPWGLTGYGFGPFAVANPGNSVAALASYWAAHTEAVLAAEDAHRGRCHRVRYEDLAASPAAAAEEIFAFLGLEPVQVPLPRGQAPACSGVSDGDEAAVPLGSVPPPLLTRVNTLLARLGYEPASPVQGMDRLAEPAVR